jgi:hypothetical protein
MRRFFFIGLLIAATIQITKAQTNIISGSTQDEKGNPLHFVFVEDRQYKTASFSDSLGNFAIEVHPDSKLQFDKAGHKDTLLSIDKSGAGLQVILRSLSAESGNSINTKSTLSTDPEFERPNEGSLPDLPGHRKGNLRGNRYLLDNFGHGFFIKSSGELVYNPNYKFDYDKVGGWLLLTKGNEAVLELSRDETKSFTLYSNTDERFVFEKAPAIDQSHFVQVLAAGKKYKIYKLIKTKFVKSDYVNNGMTSHGNDYDEYVDDADYYVLDVQGNQQQKLTLKKKSIKEDFAKEADKINKYLSDNSGSIDDAYLSKLGAYMNQ